ncbi:unnamed protein product [Prorocentrum cordatum]|uniref:AMP-dependent synthetase/ligase domain-containing protein n=1 Tax=Prorocentrum cordatum TaxID=2364126 RepID=A0ABN9PUU6_9DINO|nr:unnamed protein product [Polarella glacialis]
MADETSHPIFQTAYVVAPPVTEQKELLKAMHMIDDGTAPLTLQLRVQPPGSPPQGRPQELQLQLLFWEDVFSVESARSLKDQLGVLFAAIGQRVDSLAVPLPEVPAMSQNQYAEIKEWSDKANYSKFKPGQMHVKFLEQAKRRPDDRAIVDCLEDGRAVEYSYREFHSMCKDVCSVLTDEFGVGFDQMVPLLFDRGVMMLVAIYGVLMAGGAYVPLEPHYPSARILGILQQLIPKAVITVDTLLDKITPDALHAGTLSWAVVQLSAVSRSMGRTTVAHKDLLQIRTVPARPPHTGAAESMTRAALARQERRARGSCTCSSRAARPGCRRASRSSTRACGTGWSGCRRCTAWGLGRRRS